MAIRILSLNVGETVRQLAVYLPLTSVETAGPDTVTISISDELVFQVEVFEGYGVRCKMRWSCDPPLQDPPSPCRLYACQASEGEVNNIAGRGSECPFCRLWNKRKSVLTERVR